MRNHPFLVTALLLTFVAPAAAAAQSLSPAMCAFLRGPRCDISQAVARGMRPTGQRPVFPKGARCPKIDEAWAIDYSGVRAHKALHGGIDMPTPYGTPIVAAADGKVVRVINDPVGSYRGREVYLQHTPHQTGLPYTVYTEYAHFGKPLALRAGQRVKKGQVLGVTGNSGRGKRRGVQSPRRRPAIHFAAFYSQSTRYKSIKFSVIPKNGFWMDPLALYRSDGIVKTGALRKLPGAAKRVRIPVKFTDGGYSDASRRVIWPYMCRR